MTLIHFYNLKKKSFACLRAYYFLGVIENTA